VRVTTILNFKRFAFGCNIFFIDFTPPAFEIIREYFYFEGIIFEIFGGA
jgi:hypothetical protein